LNDIVNEKRGKSVGVGNQANGRYAKHYLMLPDRTVPLISEKCRSRISTLAGYAGKTNRGRYLHASVIREFSCFLWRPPQF
jgi:hypothetical protein